MCKTYPYIHSYTRVATLIEWSCHYLAENEKRMEVMQSQMVTASNLNETRSLSMTSSPDKRNTELTPYAFTEQGDVILSDQQLLATLNKQTIRDATDTDL
jgi:hypothetical protein